MYDGKEARSFFEMIQDFNQIVENFDMKFTWEKVDSQNIDAQTALSTALVFGECG